MMTGYKPSDDILTVLTIEWMRREAERLEKKMLEILKEGRDDTRK